MRCTCLALAPRTSTGPLTDKLLQHALSVSPNRPELSQVRDFLRDVFHFPPPRTQNAAAWQQVPNLVDVLSIVDVALDRKESLARGFDVERVAARSWSAGVRDISRAGAGAALENATAACAPQPGDASAGLQARAAARGRDLL
jgi:hypothetical protein